MHNGLLDGIGNLVCVFVDVSQAVRLIDNHQIPLNLLDVSLFASGKVIRADDDFLLLKGIQTALFDLLIEKLCFQNPRWKKELIQQLLVPLLAKIGRQDDQNSSFSLRPFLGYDYSRFDGFAQSHLICQDSPFGQGRPEGKQSSLNLMGIQVNLCIRQ